MNTIIAKEQHHTTCPYCGVGCGVTAQILPDDSIIVKGREDHPANAGKLCVKGSALHETLSADNRLTQPQINGAEVDWDTALDYTAQKWQAIVEQHGPDAVAFYLSGQLLTEDYYIANKLMKGFVGTANIDTNSRLCMASAVVAHKRAFGADAVPGCYQDLEQSDLVILVGSNAAYAHPIVYQRIVAAKKNRDFKVIVLDPRRTASCEIADTHIALRPGSDAFFFNGLLCYLSDNNAIDHSYIESFCDNFQVTLAAAKAQVPSIELAAEYCDITKDELLAAYALFASSYNVVTMFSQGINQSSSGVDKGNAIINCHLATGKIGRPGAAPFSITGQPNAMGGREVGGLANQLAAHMGFTADAIARVKGFWQAPNMAEREGLKAVDMFDAVHSGKIKAIWIMATNPVVSMPDADKVKEALEKCELVIVSDCMQNTDTAMTANVLLPATGWGEKHGTVTNSERCISLQKGFLQAPAQARHDWQIIADFACRLGYQEAFTYSHAVEIFREHAQLSALDNHRSRAFDISGLVDISPEQYDNFTPTSWPITTDKPAGTQRMFSDGYYFTDNNRAQFVPITARLPARPPAAGELIMNTGRIRDQWHTMTRTGKASRLLSHTGEPYAQLHPSDAKKWGIVEDAIVELSNNGARFLSRAKISTNQRAGETFVPMHWNAVYSSFGRADALIDAVADPISGQPEFKHCPVTPRAYAANWQGFLVSTKEITPQCDYWAKVTVAAGFSYKLADELAVDNWQSWFGQHFAADIEWVTLVDSDAEFSRIAGFTDNTLVAALIVSSGIETLPSDQWLSAQLGKYIEKADRFALLAGGPADQSQAPGAIICSCFQIGENQIIEAIDAGHRSADALGRVLKCGTNCGSCIPELSALLAKRHH